MVEFNFSMSELEPLALEVCVCDCRKYVWLFLLGVAVGWLLYYYVRGRKK